MVEEIVGLVKKMVGGFVEPVGVLVGVFGYSNKCD
jgi:hypothetical protein